MKTKTSFNLAASANSQSFSLTRRFRCRASATRLHCGIGFAIGAIVVTLFTNSATRTSCAEQTAGAASVQRAFGGVQPRLSPDGKWIALSVQGAICRLPTSGGTLTHLTRGEGFDVEPAWSPDGKLIAYINSPNFFGGRLQMIRSQDGAPIPLPAVAVARGQMYFHPDGKRLVGRFSPGGQPDRISTYDLTSGKIKPGDWQEQAVMRQGSLPLALSHDGRWIAFVLFQDVPGEQSGHNGPQADLWKVSSEGGVPEKIVRWPARIYNLCWDSADRGLYVVTDRGASHNDIWLVPLADSLKGARKITFVQADEDWPSVSSTAGFLLHTENHEGATSLVRYDTASRERQTLAIDREDFGEPIGSLRMKISDQATSQPVVAKIFLKRADGKFHAPFGALYRVTSNRLHFYCRDETELVLPAGKYELVAVRGLEYRASRMELEVKAGESASLAIRLERWTDMAANGWYSGENHIHANYGYGAWYNTPATVLDQCEGEDINVGNVMVANSDGDGVFDREFFFGQPDAKSKPRTILYWNQEFRSTLWGHLTLVNLERLVEPIFTGFKDTTNPWDVPTNADIAERTRQQRGVVSYTHPASNVEDPYQGAYSAKGLPVDAALGRINTLDVMGSGYDASVRLWYRLLNCGFRIPAAAGTDCFLNRISCLPPGWGRAYVKLPNGLSYRDWIDGQREGRSFVSNGPMLELAVDGIEPGQTIRLDAPRSVRIRAKAWAQHPLEKLELIYNGNIVASGKLANDRLTASIEEELRLDSSGWLALRTSGPIAPYHIGSSLSAHTSPVYVEVKGGLLNAKDDAEFFLAWIDRLEAALRKRDRVPAGLDHVEMQLAAARAVYKKIAQGEKP